MKGCHAFNIPNKREWWSIATSVVMANISRLRCDTATALKKAFFGKKQVYHKFPFEY